METCSGTSGKSSFINSLESDLFELNKDVDFVVLSFNMEMISSRQIGRKLSYKLRKTTAELYSGTMDQTLSDEDYNRVQKELETIKQYPIYYVDTPGTVDQIKQTILKFSQNEGKGKWVIITLDHTLLTRGKSGESEREVLSNLQHMFMEVKKYNMNTIIQLSQMNREIESVDRISNRTMHFPMRRDIFGSDSVMQGSDYLFVLHMPELLGIEAYGPKNLPTEGLIYLHCLKNREGGLGILIFENYLKYNRLEEIDISKLNNRTAQNNNLKIEI